MIKKVHFNVSYWWLNLLRGLQNNRYIIHNNVFHGFTCWYFYFNNKHYFTFLITDSFVFTRMIQLSGFFSNPDESGFN
jgi:hypothetical protein